MINKIMNCDCLEGMKLISDNSIDLVLIDPPYNIGKDSWDKINNYYEWMKKVFLEVQRVLKDNGSFYWWHNDMSMVSNLMQILEKDTNFIFRQFIVWNKRFDGSPKKGFLDGYVEVEALRNYQKMAEYCLYYTFQDETGLSKVMGSTVRPIREYIRNEIIRAKGKIVLKEINKVLGTATNGGGVASACLSLRKEHPAMITKEHYNKLRDWLNKDLRQEYEYLRQEYEYLRQEYEYLRQEYEDLRYCFNNQKTHHSVWNYDIAEKLGHITPKPLEMFKNIILHSSKEGAIVLDCFAGSGTTNVACVELNRQCIGIENNQEYVKLGRKRLREAYRKL